MPYGTGEVNLQTNPLDPFSLTIGGKLFSGAGNLLSFVTTQNLEWRDDAFAWFQFETDPRRWEIITLKGDTGRWLFEIPKVGFNNVVVAYNQGRWQSGNNLVGGSPEMRAIYSVLPGYDVNFTNTLSYWLAFNSLGTGEDKTLVVNECQCTTTILIPASVL